MAESINLVGQTIKKQVTITTLTSDTVQIPIPKDRKVYLKGYGYTWFTTNEFYLSTGQIQLPKRTDQEGSTSIPRIFEKALECRSGGNLELRIYNGDSSDHTYDVVFYLLTDQILEGSDYESTGGDLSIPTGSGGVTNSVVIYDSSLTTAANVTAYGVAVDPQPPPSLYAGTKATTSASAVAIASSQALKRGVHVMALTTNTDLVLLGNATSQVLELGPGQSIFLEIDNLADVYIKRNGSANVTINYLGS